MHSAPAVSYPVGRSRFQGWLVGLAGLMGVVIGVLWRSQADLTAWRQWLFFMTLLGACLVASQAWRRTPMGRLCWDGQAWTWISAGQAVCGVVAVHLDFQFLLLLSLRTEAGARLWLWPERRVAPMRWHALRCAVFSRSGAAQAQNANTEAALLQLKS